MDQKNSLQTKLDAQQVEVVGRGILTARFVADNIEIAKPERDKGIDLIAYKSVGESNTLLAVPVQLKAFSEFGFSLDERRYRNMLMAYVWHVAEPNKAEVFVMTFDQAVEAAQTPYFEKNRHLFVRNPSKKLLSSIEQYRCTPGYLSRLMDQLSSVQVDGTRL